MASTLTPMQKELLKMFDFNHSDDLVIELKKVWGDYLQKKLDEELDRLWDNGVLNQERLNELRHQDLHQMLREYAKARS